MTVERIKEIISKKADTYSRIERLALSLGGHTKAEKETAIGCRQIVTVLDEILAEIRKEEDEGK